MPFTLTMASGRVTPTTVIVFAETRGASTRDVSRDVSNGEVISSCNAAEVSKRAGTGVKLGLMFRGVGVAGRAVSGMAVEGIGEGVAVEEIAGTEVGSGAGEVAASSPPQAANNNKSAAIGASTGASTGKGPNLIHHRPNTWMLISCYGP